MSKKTPKAEMLWIDLETTGLDPLVEVPIELGLVVTNRWGDILDSRDWLIHDETSEYKDTIARARNHRYVGPMHEKSGLWADLANRESFPRMGTRSDVELMACDWLDELGIPVNVLPMCGASIGSLDRPFVQFHLPKLNTHFHYRNIDITSIRKIAELLNPRIYKHEPADPTDGHRVLEDAKVAIDRYKYYVREFMLVAD